MIAANIAILYYISKMTAALELLTVATNTNVWRRIIDNLPPLGKLVNMSTHCLYQANLEIKLLRISSDLCQTLPILPLHVDDCS